MQRKIAVLLIGNNELMQALEYVRNIEMMS